MSGPSAAQRRAARQFGRAMARARATARRAAKNSASPAQPAISPLAPKRGFPEIRPVPGVELATAAAGVRYAGRDDVLLVRLAPGSAMAGVTTRSATRAANVLDVEAKLAAAEGGGEGAAILVNSGNANAFTGAAGGAAVASLAAAVGAELALPPARVFTASTGVIGEPLPAERIAASIARLAETLAPGGFKAAARAIGTTDTFPKGAQADAEAAGAVVRVAGIAKGSGMIAPDMATMLAFVFTDAAVEPAHLQAMTARAAAASFNRVSVDGDTSTSDMLLVAATGLTGPPIEPGRTAADALEAALGSVCGDLAQQIVRDGEGASKFVEIAVTGAVSDSEADLVARAIANSPLVKTAFAGSDPNWGRIVMAVGKSGATADRDRLSIRFGDVLVAECGQRARAYVEAEAAAYMAGDALRVGVDLGLGQGHAIVWTCDLTHSYVSINADYRS